MGGIITVLLVDCVVREIAANHVDTVLAIEEGGASSPWTDADMAAELGRPDSCAVVALAHGRVMGWMCYRVSPGARMVRLERLTVHPAYRRVGVGSSLLSMIECGARSINRTCLAHVPERQLALCCLLRSRGWRAFSVRRDTSGVRDDRISFTWIPAAPF